MPLLTKFYGILADMPLEEVGARFVCITVFMLIECMIQLLQENSIPGIVCILWKTYHIPSSIWRMW